MDFQPKFDPRTGRPRIPSKATADLLTPPGAISATEALKFAKQSLDSTKQSLVRLQLLNMKTESDFRKARQSIVAEDEDSYGSESRKDQTDLWKKTTSRERDGEAEAQNDLTTLPILPEELESITPSPYSPPKTPMSSGSTGSSVSQECSRAQTPTFSSSPRPVSRSSATYSSPVTELSLAQTAKKEESPARHNDTPRQPWLHRLPRQPHSDRSPKAPKVMYQSGKDMMRRRSALLTRPILRGQQPSEPASSNQLRSLPAVLERLDNRKEADQLIAGANRQPGPSTRWIDSRIFKAEAQLRTKKNAWFRSRDRVRECEWDIIVLEEDINYLHQLMRLRGEVDEDSRPQRHDVAA